MAMRLASVPELVKRTRSRANRSHIKRASIASPGWMPPTLTFVCRAVVTASRTRRLAVAQQTRGVVAEEIDIRVAVDIGERGPLSRHERQRKRGVGEHGAGVAAGQVPAGLLVVLPAARVPVGELLARAIESSEHVAEGSECR